MQSPSFTTRSGTSTRGAGRLNTERAMIAKTEAKRPGLLSLLTSPARPAIG
jgi:hypothetical protein